MLITLLLLILISLVVIKLDWMREEISYAKDADAEGEGTEAGQDTETENEGASVDFERLDDGVTS